MACEIPALFEETTCDEPVLGSTRSTFAGCPCDVAIDPRTCFSCFVNSVGVRFVPSEEAARSRVFPSKSDTAPCPFNFTAVFK